MHRRPEVILAYSVSIGDKSYHLDDEDAILVTVSDILHIIIPMSNLAPALYIDIPLSQVGDVTIEKVDFQSQSRSKIVKSLEVLTVCFLKSSSNGFFINAARCVSASIQLTFTSSKDATTIRKSLGGFGPRMIENLRISQSEPINVSQNLYANREGTLREGLESHQGTNSRTSRSTPHLSLPRTDYTKPGNALEWTPGRNNEGRSVSTHNNENVSTACSPIPIQRPNEPLINPVNDLGIFEDQSEGRIDSSTEWRKGARVIDSAPELQSKHYELTGESAMPVRDHTPIKLTTFERDDILYSATPRANESRQPQDRGRDSQCDKSLKLQSAVYKKTASMADSTIDSVGHLQNGEQFISNRMETFRGSSITSRNINNIQAGKRRVSRQDSSSGNVTSPDEGETREPARTEKLSTAHLNETRGCDSKTTTRTKNDGKDDFGILATPQNQQKTKKISLLSKSALQGSNLLKLKYGAKRMTDISSKDQLTLIPENTESELNQVKKVPHNATIKPPVPLESMIDAADKDDTNWDEGLIDDETEPNPPRRKIPCVKQKPKKPLARSRNKDDDAYSVKKGLPGQGRKAKRKAQPVPKTMRIADMAVNQDLQNLAHSNARRDQIKAPLFTPTLGFTEKQSGRDENIPKERVVPVIKMSVESVAEFEPQMFELQSNASRSRASDDPNESDLAAIPLKFDESKYGDGFEGPNIIDGKANQPSINDRGVPSITHTSFLSQACNTYQDETTVENPHAKIPLTLGKSQEEVTNRTTHSRQEDDIDSICGSAPRHNGKRINQEAFNAEEQTFTNANISDATTDGFVADAIIYSVGPKPQEYKTRKGDLKITKSKTRTADSTVLQAHQTISEGSSNDVDGNSANLNARAKPVIATKLEIALASVNSRKAQHLQPGTQIPGRPNEIDFVAKKPILAEEELESKFPNGQGKLVSGTKKVHDETINESTKPDEGQPKNLRNDPSWLSPRNSQPLVQKSHPSIIRISASSEPEASIESGCHDEITFIGQGLLQDGRELEKSVAFGNDLVRAVLQPDLNTASHNSHHSQNSRHCRKRNIDQTPLDTRKRIKSLSAKSSCSALFSSKADAPFTTPKNSSYHNRKTKLISFNSKGPRNQGKIPRSARQSDKVIIPESIHQSNEVPVIPTGRLHEVGSNTCLKRKSMASDEEEDGSPEMILVEKKSRTFAVANTQTKSPEKAGPHQTLVSRDTTSKPSSQNIKVDENGSPMRVASSPLKTIEVAPVFGYTNGEDGAFGTFNDKFIEANLPDKVEKSPKLVRFAKVIPLSNNKHLPSSPNASRIAAGLTAHTAHACGKFINIQTENTVMPVRPLDPFLEPGQDQYHPNTFMNLLRRSSDLDTDKKNSPRVSPKAVDTDKTLVDAESCEEVVRPDSSSAGCSVPDDSSSSTESYSGGSSRSQELVSNDQDLSEEAAWHKALKPHQRYTLDILCEVSHV